LEEMNLGDEENEEEKLIDSYTIDAKYPSY
jgi:hypothetical protein